MRESTAIGYWLLAVEMVGLDVIVDRGRQEIAEFHSLGNAAADFARGDLEQGCIHKAYLVLESRQDGFERGQLDRFARAAHHANFMAGRHQVRGTMPGGQSTQVVPAHQQDQVCCGILLLEDFQRIHGVLWRGTVEFDSGKFEGRLLQDGALHHFQPVRNPRDGVGDFVRGMGRKHPQQSRQAQLPARFAGKDEVAEMWRIKCPAKDANPFGHTQSISYLGLIKLLLWVSEQVQRRQHDLQWAQMRVTFFLLWTLRDGI